MRTLAILAAFALTATALAGCVGGDDGGDELDKTGAATTGGATTSTGGANSGSTPQLKVLLPLNGTLTVGGPQWVQAGTEVPVSFAEPKNAKGAITYTWATGALPGTTKVDEIKVDTGSAKATDYIQPGASKSIVYGKSGVYALHCHPHPAMRHNVTVVDGLAKSTVEVSIVDGDTAQEYRYFPENVVVGTGSTVVYKNVGSLPHTATSLGAQSPGLKKLDLAAASGALKAEGGGWQRIVLIIQDSEGRVGVLEKPLYVTATLPTFKEQSIAVEYAAMAAPLVGTGAEPAAAQEFPITLEHPALVTLNYTFQDGLSGAGAPENLAEVEIHFFKQGETQDTLTDDAAQEGTQTGKAVAGTYILRVIPKQGAEVTGTILVTAVYELVPPAIGPAPAEPAGGHGGHAH